MNNCTTLYFIYAILNISIAFFFGSIFGVGEMLQRYENLKYFFKVKMSFFYIFLNGFVSVIALFFIKYIKYHGESVLNFHYNIEIFELLYAGFGGMMVLRSSIFSMKSNDKTIEIGLGSLFQVFLNRAERNMKNNAAALRLKNIDKIMKGVDFALAIQGLPVICTAFIEKFSDEEREKLLQEVNEIVDLKIDDKEKSLLLGRVISSYCDEEILKVAVNRYNKSVVEDEISAKRKKLNKGIKNEIK